MILIRLLSESIEISEQNYLKAKLATSLKKLYCFVKRETKKSISTFNACSFSELSIDFFDFLSFVSALFTPIYKLDY